VPIHPNVVKACRPRYRAAGGKHDEGDAYLLADVLRTDGHRFRALTPVSDAIQALRAMVRTRDDLVAERIGLANQLRSLLESFWPGASTIFADIDSPIALAFVEHYPTPSSAARLGEKRLAGFLALEQYSGRRPLKELLQRIREAPVGMTGPAEQEAKGELAKALARILVSLVREIARLTSRIEHEVTQLTDGQILMSLPRTGRLNAAQILSELGDVRERFCTDDQLAAEAGLVPVTKQSGKSKAVVFRWACNHRLRRAITLWADNSRRASSWAKAIYTKARNRGCRHPHAIRILARAWIRVLWRLWTNRSCYQPAQHNGAAPFLQEVPTTT
jgi:transposase